VQFNFTTNVVNKKRFTVIMYGNESCKIRYKINYFSTRFVSNQGE